MKAGLIDWTADNLTLYVLEKKGDQYTIADTISVPIKDEVNDALISSLVTTTLGTVYLSLPAAFLTLREQVFPFSDRDKINDTLAYELQGTLLGDINDYSIDHIVLQSSGSGSKLLAVCLEKTRLQEIINMFSNAGLEPKVITALDLRLAGGESEKLTAEPDTNIETRSRAAAEEFLSPSINLRKNDLAYTGDIMRFHKSLRHTAVLTLTLLIILCIFSSFRLINHKKEHEALDKELKKIYLSVFPEDNKIIDIMRQFKGNVITLKNKKEALTGIPLLDILKSISLNKNDKIRLHEFNTDGKTLLIKGGAESFEDVERLKDSLSSAFDEVKVIDSNATRDNKIDFTIRMREKAV